MSKMNESLISAILSPTGIKLLSHFPKSKRSAINIETIAEKSNIANSTAYRLIKDLKKWNNIISIKNSKDSLGRPEILYYIKSKNFTIILKHNETQLRVIQA